METFAADGGVQPQLQPHLERVRYQASEGGTLSALVIRRTNALKPHPSYARHQITVPASKLSTLAELGDLAFRKPIVITQDGAIVDGYGRWELARQTGRLTLECVEYNLSEAEALQLLLQSHLRSKGMNDFNRILLALDLTSGLEDKARSNQRLGGQSKGSSKLTEVEKLNVRYRVALAAGASTGNVTKVKQLRTGAHPDVLAALREGEVSIHRAWKWSTLSLACQREQLRLYRSERGIVRKIRALISKHRPEETVVIRQDVGDLARRLVASDAYQPITVAVVKTKGRILVLTEELLQALGMSQLTICATDSR